MIYRHLYYQQGWLIQCGLPFIGFNIIDQRMSKLLNCNKENMRGQSFIEENGSSKRKPITKSHSGQTTNNETAYFNYPYSEAEVEKQGQQKLIQLTAQCAQYYQRFTSEKDTHLQIINRAFTEVTEKVDLAFGRIILQAQRKLNQIRLFLGREHQRLKEEKRGQEEELNKLLVEIKSTHLSKLDQSGVFDRKAVLVQYAATLDKFFNIMNEIESNSYQQNVEECMNFINNLVKQELRSIVQHKFPPRVEDIFGSQPTNDQCFTFHAEGIRLSEETVSFEQVQSSKKENVNQSNYLQELNRIKNRQCLREGHINQYRSMILSSNPFKGVKLTQ